MNTEVADDIRQAGTFGVSTLGCTFFPRAMQLRRSPRCTHQTKQIISIPPVWTMALPSLLLSSKLLIPPPSAATVAVAVRVTHVPDVPKETAVTGNCLPLPFSDC